MFMREIDWNNPKFSRWKLSNLDSLSEAQIKAIWEDDEIDVPPITESEQIQLCKQFDCRINLSRNNVCYGIERDWPRKYFNATDFKSLKRQQQIQLHRTMVKNAISIYNKHINPERMKKRIKLHNANVLAPFLEERRCRLRFERIKKIGENERREKGLSLVEKNAKMPKISVNKGRRPDIQNTIMDTRSTRSRRSADTLRHENNTNLEKLIPSNQQTTNTEHGFTSIQKEVASISNEKTPDRRLTRSTHDLSKGRKKGKESEVRFTTSTRQSLNVTPNRPLTRSATKNVSINKSITLQRHRQGMARSIDSSDATNTSNRLSLTSRQIFSDAVLADNQKLPRRSSRITNNISLNAQRSFFTSNEGIQTIISTQSTQNEDFTFRVDTPSFDSPEGESFIDLSSNFGTPTVYRQPSYHNVKNSTPDLTIDESVSQNYANEENYSEEFAYLGGNQTSTQNKTSIHRIRS